MLVLSIMTVLEEAVSDERKFLSGNIRSFDELLRSENLAMLEAHYKAFAFIAFHPKADEVVTEYIRAGSLASDSGPKILTLFTLDDNARVPKTITNESLAQWIELDVMDHPAYFMVRTIFEPKVSPPLPGLLFFQKFTPPQGVIYAHLQGLDSKDAVRDRCRIVFSLAQRSLHEAELKGENDFDDRLGAMLHKQRIPYSKADPASMQEWLVRSYQFVGKFAGDIVSVVSLFK